MKTLAIAMMMILPLAGIAQRGPGNCPNGGPGSGNCKMIPNLTDDQQKKIDALNVKHLKEVTNLKNQVKIKEAELRVLETADKPDKNAIDKKIDEIMTLKTQLAKAGANHRQEVRALLTDEQKVYFDAMPRGKGGCCGGYHGGGQGGGYRGGPGPNPNAPFPPKN